MKTVHKKDKFSASDGTLVRAVEDDRRDEEVLELEAADTAGGQPAVRIVQPMNADDSAAFDNLLDHPKWRFNVILDTHLYSVNYTIEVPKL